MATIGPDRLGRLFDEHAPALVLYARQWYGAPEDVVQEAFVQLARHRVEPDRVIPWLFRVVRNGAIGAARRDSRRRRREAKVSAGEAWFATDDDRLDAGHAARLLAELDPETREVLVARLWGGLTLEEAARLQGCSTTTAHRRYRAGLARLQEILGCPTESPRTT
jgi:RNA polymerase sigma factor (sigma-70 family)